MKPIIAERIKTLRTGNRIHSWRRIAEVICDEFPDFVEETYGSIECIYGNQLYGKEMCQDARDVLGISNEQYEKEWI